MSDPIVTCKTCGNRRNVMPHASANSPVESAKRFLRKQCDQRGECELVYVCGIQGAPDSFAARVAEEARNG